MPLLKAGKPVGEDAWTPVADDDALPADGGVVISYDRWFRERDTLAGRNAPLALAIANDRDVQALGTAMIQISSDARERDEKLADIRSYDPSLFFLLEWMTSEDPPSMVEVLRHPYFMSPSERQTFAIAIGGGMIAEYLRTPEQTGLSVIADAILPRLNEHLKIELDRLIARTHQQNTEKAALAAQAARDKAAADFAAAREAADAATATAAAAAAAAVLEGQEAAPADAAASDVPADPPSAIVEAAQVNLPARRGRGGGGVERSSGGVVDRGRGRGGGRGGGRGAGGSALPPVGRGNLGGADPPMSGDD